MSENKRDYKTRLDISTATRNLVLDEFDHECAFCGDKNVDLHHIDSDPSHNNVMNLIPLCPTHHREQHNRRKIEVGILKLFRKYKKHKILDPKFEPIFDRMKYIYSLDRYAPHDSAYDDTDAIIAAEQQSKNLTRFLSYFAQGSFYAHEVEILTKPDDFDEVGNDVRNFGITSRYWREEDRPHHVKYVTALVADYQAMLLRNRDQIERLIVEMLVYQDWTPIYGGKSRLP